MRFRMVAADQLGTTEFECMVPADEREIVSNLISAANGALGQKDVGSQVIHKAGDLQSGLPGFVWNDMEEVIVKLQAQFVLSCGAELMVKGGQNVVIIGFDRAACRKARQRLHVGILLVIVSVSVSHANLVRITAPIIEPSGPQVLAGVVRE